MTKLQKDEIQNARGVRGKTGQKTSFVLKSPCKQITNAPNHTFQIPKPL